MRRLISLTTLCAALLVSTIGVISCQSSPSPALDVDAIRAYADPATETTLQGISENDLEKYTRYGNADFKAAVTPEILDRVAGQINSQLGSYQSKEFLTAETQDSYIVVHYRARFEKGEAGIRMVFDEEHLVAGQWFE